MYVLIALLAMTHGRETSPYSHIRASVIGASHKTACTLHHLDRELSCLLLQLDVLPSRSLDSARQAQVSSLQIIPSSTTICAFAHHPVHTGIDRSCSYMLDTGLVRVTPVYARVRRLLGAARTADYLVILVFLTTNSTIHIIRALWQRREVTHRQASWSNLLHCPLPLTLQIKRPRRADDPPSPLNRSA